MIYGSLAGDLYSFSLTLQFLKILLPSLPESALITGVPHAGQNLFFLLHIRSDQPWLNEKIKLEHCSQLIPFICDKNLYVPSNYTQAVMITIVNI